MMEPQKGTILPFAIIWKKHLHTHTYAYTYTPAMCKRKQLGENEFGIESVFLGNYAAAQILAREANG